MKKNIIFLIVFSILGIATYYTYSTYKETLPEQETKIDLPDSGVSEQWFKQWEEKK